MSGPTDAGATGPSPTPTGSLSPGTRPPPSGLSRAAKVAIVVVIVAVVAVGVVAAGVVPGVALLPKSHSSASTEVSSSTAVADADQAAAAHDAGSLVLALGVSTTYSFQFGNESGNSECPVAHPLLQNFTVPVESASYASGDAALWLFVYANPSVNESLVAVVGSTTYFLGTTSGTTCALLSSLQALPSTFVSSTTIATAVDARDGSFLLAHSTANSLFLAFENGTAGPEWVVAYTNCSYDPATQQAIGGPKGDLLYATANGTNGAVTGFTDLVGEANCSSLASSPGTTVYYLGMVPVSNSSMSSSYYDFLELASPSGLTTAMLGFTVTNATDVTQPTATVPAACHYGVLFSACTAGTGWYGILLSASDDVLATYGALGWGDLAPSTTNVSLADATALVIVSNVPYAGLGYTLSAKGTGTSLVSGSTLL